MSDTPYSIRREATLQYSFFSEGPKGRIEKLIRYSPFGERLYNLGFGDRIPGTDDFNDKVVTDNGDAPRVMATVISTLEFFFEQYPDKYVFIKGSTKGRTLAYYRIVKNYRKNFKDKYEFYGGKGIVQESFEESKDYDFITIRKKRGA